MMYTEPMRQNKNFQQCYHRGKSIVSRNVVIYAMKNRLSCNRLGITTGKKIGNAVCRSRARRLIRQAWRENELDAPIGLDIVIVARSPLLETNSVVLSGYFRKTAIPALQRIYSGEAEPRREKGRKS